MASLTAQYFNDLHDIFSGPSSKLPAKRYSILRHASPEVSKKLTAKEKKELKKEKKEKKWHKTGYFLFTENKKAELRQVPEYEKLKMTEMSTLIAQKWNNLPEPEQNIWKQKAERLRIESEAENKRRNEYDWQSSDSDSRKRQKT